MSFGTCHQIGKVSALIASAQQNDGTLFAKCGKRLQRRINISCLGVVVAVNACDGSAGLDTVFQWSEGLQTLFDFCIVAIQRDGARSRRKRIGCIVLALDLELRSGAKGMLDTLEIYREHTIVKECRGIGPACIFTHALVKTVTGAQRDVCELALFGRLLLQLAYIGAHNIIRGIEHYRAVFIAVGIYLLLRLGICLETSMPFQMIGRDVQQHGDLRLEELCGRKLVRGNLSNIAFNVARCHRIDACVTDIAYRLGLLSACSKDMSSHRRSCGLTVSTRYGNPYRIGGAFTPCKLNFANTLRRNFLSRMIEVRILGYARAGDAYIE